MKKYAIFALCLVLTVSLLAGCGCTAQDNNTSDMPSATDPILPTNIPETTVPTEPATRPATQPATEATDASTMPSDDAGIADDSTAETGTGTRSRMR